jgi:hypothetical protein
MRAGRQAGTVKLSHCEDGGGAAMQGKIALHAAGRKQQLGARATAIIGTRPRPSALGGLV